MSLIACESAPTVDPSVDQANWRDLYDARFVAWAGEPVFDSFSIVAPHPTKEWLDRWANTGLERNYGPELEKVWYSTPRWELPRSTATGLALLKPPHACDILLEMAVQPGRFIDRYDAIWGLGLLGDKRAISTLRTIAVNDEDPAARFQAIRSMVVFSMERDRHGNKDESAGSNEDWMCNVVLIRSLLNTAAKTDVDPAVRLAAQRSLEYLDNTEKK